MVLLSQPYVTIGKTITLTIQTFASRVMCLLSIHCLGLHSFPVKKLSSNFMASDLLLISRLQSPSMVILEPKKGKSITTSTFSPSICHEVMGLEAMMLAFFFFF